MKMGENDKETAREKFLMTTLLEDYLDRLNGFESNFRYIGKE